MQIRLTRSTARILLILLAPIVAASKLLKRLTGSTKKPVYVNTVERDPLLYNGDHPLIVSVWATWASFWEITAQIVDQLKAEFGGRCEFAYVECVDRSIREKYSVDVLPAVLVYQHGEEVVRFINMIQVAELRKAIDSLVDPLTQTASPAPSTRPPAQ